jgi:alanyl-tRNA synthetase
MTARKRLEGELAVHQARALYEMTGPTPAGVRVTVLRRDGGSLEDIRPLAQAFASLPKTVFVAAVLSPATVLVAAADDAGVDAGRLLKATLAGVAGRGGGSPRLAQGTVPNADALEGVVNAIRDAIA